MTTAASNRGKAKTALEAFSELLRSKRNGPLASQEGATADDIRLAFQNGEAQARDAAEKNETKAKSYSGAHQSVSTLREGLSEIAKTGNDSIENILASKQPVAAKVEAITNIVIDAQTDANGKAAEYCGNVYTSIQNILTKDGRPETAREFVKGLGIDLDRAFTSPDANAVQKQVEALVERASSSPSTATQAGKPSTNVLATPLDGPSPITPEAGAARGDANGAASASDTATKLDAAGTAPPPASAGPPPPTASKSEAQQIRQWNNGDNKPYYARSDSALSARAAEPAGQETALPRGDAMGTVSGSSFYGEGSQGSSLAPPSANTDGALAPIATAPNPTSPVANPSPTSQAHTSVPSFTASAPSPTALSSLQSLTPEGLAQSFNTGMQSGGPISAGTEALSHNAFDAISTPVQHQPEFSAPPAMNSATTMPTAGGHFAFETAATPAAEATSNYVPPAQTTSAFYAAPMPPAPMPTAPPVAPMGPLPAYGADLRPAIGTHVAPPPSAPPLAPSPASAPVGPAAGAGSLNQSPVVRQQPTAPNPPTPAVAVTENAAAAATAGALAGAASARNTARTRLQKLIEAVARQEPRLRWAIGDREDGSTVLTTDLASGWIPPHIEMPSGVQLLPPARRRGGLETMLGDTTNTASWTPGQYLPPAADVDPVPMSFRSRQLPSVDDLNWELTQAANWRDGLPRLAHTLAKAGVAGTGVLDSEADLLRDHLHAIGKTVLKSYPDTVDAAAIANWQLLAAIDALIGGRKTELNYHFAWFQALSMAKAGGAR